MTPIVIDREQLEYRLYICVLDTKSGNDEIKLSLFAHDYSKYKTNVLIIPMMIKL